MVACATYGMTLCTALLVARIAWAREDGGWEERCRSTQQSVHEQSAKVTQLKGELADVRHRLQVAQSVCTQPDWGLLLVLLASVMDDNVVLSECDLVTVDSQATEITNDLKTWLSSSPIETLLSTRRYRLKVTGFARTQSSLSEFVLGLEHTKVFESVRLVKSCRQAFRDGQAIAFSIDCWM